MSTSERGLSRFRRQDAVVNATQPSRAAPQPASGKFTRKRESLEARYVRALDLVWLAFQPIVSWRARRILGYEVLLRSAEPTLSTPAAILEAAERLGRVCALGRAVRHRVAIAAAEAPPDVHYFVNLHASDLNDEHLYATNTPFASIARRVILEITERVSLDVVHEVEERVKHLRGSRFKIAIDDLGAGYAGLSSFARLEPDVAKLDMTLVRNIDGAPFQRKVVATILAMCADLGIHVVAEGIETIAERDALVALGCDQMQGYLFARPAAMFPLVSW
jgi:EAL domain-containing protein (putative c-di-GMP-specific phosphodiesterase class I)